MHYLSVSFKGLSFCKLYLTFFTGKHFACDDMHYPSVLFKGLSFCKLRITFLTGKILLPMSCTTLVCSLRAYPSETFVPHSLQGTNLHVLPCTTVACCLGVYSAINFISHSTQGNKLVVDYCNFFTCSPNSALPKAPRHSSHLYTFPSSLLVFLAIQICDLSTTLSLAWRLKACLTVKFAPHSVQRNNSHLATCTNLACRSRAYSSENCSSHPVHVASCNFFICSPNSAISNIVTFHILSFVHVLCDSFLHWNQTNTEWFKFHFNFILCKKFFPLLETTHHTTYR